MTYIHKITLFTLDNENKNVGEFSWRASCNYVNNPTIRYFKMLKIKVKNKNIVLEWFKKYGM